MPLPPAPPNLTLCRSPLWSYLFWVRAILILHFVLYYVLNTNKYLNYRVNPILIFRLQSCPSYSYNVLHSSVFPFCINVIEISPCIYFIFSPTLRMQFTPSSIPAWDGDWGNFLSRRWSQGQMNFPVSWDPHSPYRNKKYNKITIKVMNETFGWKFCNNDIVMHMIKLVDVYNIISF